ncbi:hypothetical protein ON010_g10971 [Phytophthora cinnamomi]|nr:hypothetical protein ON010_g10971 [Phytophthora cinnamomi]
MDDINDSQRVQNGGDEDSDWFDLGIVDVEAETESKRQEAEARLRTKSNELKRFHDKICMRVTERERQNRLEVQRAQDYLAIHLDAQIRDDLLRSTEIPRSGNLVNDECEYVDDTNVTPPAESPFLLPEQVSEAFLREFHYLGTLTNLDVLKRVALYATVRRQYMEMNRAKIQKNVWRGASKTKAKSPLSNSSVAAAVRGSKARRANSSSSVECWAAKVIDMTSGYDVRVHRQTATSSTPWRKKTTKGSSTQVVETEHERFLRALQAQLRTPALCSCAKAGPNSTSSSDPCANNCALYKQPKKREKLLASVYKQQQLDTTAAASPTH